jgi:putative hemolysin
MIEILIIVLCVFFNALLALVEMAFVSVSKSEIKSLSKNNPIALKLLKLRDRPERTLSVLQIGITIVGAISAAVGGIGAEEKVSPYFQEFGLSESISKVVAVFLVVVPLTYINTVIGELVPKTLALRFPMKISLRSVYALSIAEKVLSPFVVVLEKSTQICLKLFSFPSKSSAQFSEASEALNISNLSNAHQQYVINLVHIETKKMKDIMLPWDKVNLIYSYSNLNEVLSMVIKSGHTRLPVVDNEEVIGILHSKEFITFISSGDENWKNIIRPILKIGPNEGILKTLRLMQEKKSHMALVLSGDDKLGIVTLEDIFEEIIGDIYDEDDDGMLRKVLSQRMFKMKK